MPARNVVSNGIPNSKVRYSRLATDDDGYIDLQFKKSPPKVPYKAIALATILFLIGSLLIIIGALLLAGYFGVTVSNFLGHTFSCYILLLAIQCHHVKRINVFFLLAHRPDRACPHHRDPCLPAWILPPTDSLLCIKGLPGVLL
uniref:Transmembrane protein 230b n=2 Tax=Haplochromini TaxID=319058 RepID=A0A3P9BWV8_9CICH